MREIKFLVQGSSSEPYVTVFKKVNNNLSAYCTCPAGKNGMYCKHRFRILEGSAVGIVSENISDVDIVKTWLIGSDVEKVMDELGEAENVFLEAKKNVSILKKKLARAFLD